MNTVPLRPWKLAFAAVGVLALFTACYSAYHRLPWSDEGWLSSSSHNLATRHSPGMPVMRELSYGWKVTRIEQHNYWIFPGMIVWQALWYQVFPATIFWTRLASMVWFPVTLAAVFFYLRRLFPDRGAVPWLGMLLLAGNFVMLDNASFGRADTACAALGLGALAVYTHWRTENLNRALMAANFLTALSGIMHPDGIYHWVTLMTLILWLDARRIRVSSVGYALVPYLALGALWGWYLAQDPQAVRDQLTANSSARFPGWNPILLLQLELQRYATAYGLVTGGINRLKLISLSVCWLAVATAAGVKALNRLAAVRLLLLQCGLVFVGLSIFNEKSSFYLIHIVPFYLMLAAVCVDWLWSSRPHLRPWIVAALAGVILVDMSGMVLKSYMRSYIAGQAPAMKFVQETARPQDTIMASAALVFGLQFDPRQRDDGYLGLYSGLTPEMIIVDPLYRILQEDLQQRGQAEADMLRDRLARFYRKAYDSPDYQVWLRMDLP